MATVGGNPLTRSTSCFSSCSTNCRAYGDMLSRKRRCPSKQNVERERRFPGAAESGDHYQLLPRNFDMNVLKIVLSRAVNMDRSILLRVGERTRLACSVRRLGERSFGGT